MTAEPDMKEKLEPSCRLAFSAYVHDLGKLAERARIAEADRKDDEGNTAPCVSIVVHLVIWNSRMEFPRGLERASDAISEGEKGSGAEEDTATEQ